jgi:hypothetical protein
MSEVPAELRVSNKKGKLMETKGYEVRVINNDKTEQTYLYAPHPGRWTAINEYYGDLVQEGKIYTCFIKMV